MRTCPQLSLARCKCQSPVDADGAGGRGSPGGTGVRDFRPDKQFIHAMPCACAERVPSSVTGPSVISSNRDPSTALAYEQPAPRRRTEGRPRRTTAHPSLATWTVRSRTAGQSERETVGVPCAGGEFTPAAARVGDPRGVDAGGVPAVAESQRTVQGCVAVATDPHGWATGGRGDRTHSKVLWARRAARSTPAPSSNGRRGWREAPRRSRGTGGFTVSVRRRGSPGHPVATPQLPYCLDSPFGRTRASAEADASGHPLREHSSTFHSRGSPPSQKTQTKNSSRTTFS